MINPFLESDGSWSWRKTGTAIVFLLFAYTIIGHQITHHWDELPGSYQGIIAGVFGFYFLKKTLGNIKLTNKDK